MTRLDDVPATLGHAGIAARVPHAGAMCLLEGLLRWDADEIECSITGHADPTHPLREHSEEGGVVQDHGLPATSAIEYAAQAMALHASLQASLQAAAKATSMSDGVDEAAPTPGFLASAREVRLHVPRLDAASGPLRVLVRRHAGDGRQAMYRFVLHDAAGARLVEGRATVVLNSPLLRPDKAQPAGAGGAPDAALPQRT